MRSANPFQFVPIHGILRKEEEGGNVVDCYEVLGVAHTATQEEIWRRIGELDARARGDPTVALAIATLTSAKRRQLYDRTVVEVIPAQAVCVGGGTMETPPPKVVVLPASRKKVREVPCTYCTDGRVLWGLFACFACKGRRITYEPVP